MTCKNGTTTQEINQAKDKTKGSFYSIKGRWWGRASW